MPHNMKKGSTSKLEKRKHLLSLYYFVRETRVPLAELLEDDADVGRIPSSSGTPVILALHTLHTLHALRRREGILRKKTVESGGPSEAVAGSKLHLFRSSLCRAPDWILSTTIYY